MKSVDQHLADCLAAVDTLSPLELRLLDAHGCTLSEDVTATWDLPPFTNSSMDGYAVRSADLSGASTSTPVVLPVVGDIPAGYSGALALSPGQCARIMTGGPMPAGADAVVPVEWTDGDIVEVSITKAPQPSSYVRFQGEDAAQGDLVVPAGTRLGPAQLALLAAVGRARVLVRPRPRVVVMSTGSELVEPGEPDRRRKDPRLQQLHARRGRERGWRHRLPHRLRPGRAQDPHHHHRGPADPRRPGDHHRRRQRRRVRRGEGGTRSDGNGLVRPRRDAARHAAGLRHDRSGQHPDLHSARQPGLGLRLVRDVRPTGAASDAGARAVAPPHGPRRAQGGRAVARRESGSSCGATSTSRTVATSSAPSAAPDHTCWPAWPTPTA